MGSNDSIQIADYLELSSEAQEVVSKQTKFQLLPNKLTVFTLKWSGDVLSEQTGTEIRIMLTYLPGRSAVMVRGCTGSSSFELKEGVTLRAALPSSGIFSETDIAHLDFNNTYLLLRFDSASRQITFCVGTSDDTTTTSLPTIIQEKFNDGHHVFTMPKTSRYPSGLNQDDGFAQKDGVSAVDGISNGVAGTYMAQSVNNSLRLSFKTQGPIIDELLNLSCHLRTLIAVAQQDVDGRHLQQNFSDEDGAAFACSRVIERSGDVCTVEAVHVGDARNYILDPDGQLLYESTDQNHSTCYMTTAADPAAIAPLVRDLKDLTNLNYNQMPRDIFDWVRDPKRKSPDLVTILQGLPPEKQIAFRNAVLISVADDLGYDEEDFFERDTDTRALFLKRASGRNILKSCIAHDAGVFFPVRRVFNNVPVGSRLFACSDGLYKVKTDDEVRTSLCLGDIDSLIAAVARSNNLRDDVIISTTVI